MMNEDDFIHNSGCEWTLCSTLHGFVLFFFGVFSLSPFLSCFVCDLWLPNIKKTQNNNNNKTISIFVQPLTFKHLRYQRIIWNENKQHFMRYVN